MFFIGPFCLLTFSLFPPSLPSLFPSLPLPFPTAFSITPYSGTPPPSLPLTPSPFSHRRYYVAMVERDRLSPEFLKISNVFIKRSESLIFWFSANELWGSAERGGEGGGGNATCRGSARLCPAATWAESGRWGRRSEERIREREKEGVRERKWHVFFFLRLCAIPKNNFAFAICVVHEMKCTWVLFDFPLQDIESVARMI